MRPLRILTWHVHGSYLYYLSQVAHEFYVPVKPGRPEGYGGRAGWLPWPDNLHEVTAEDVRRMRFDCVLFQSRRNYEYDQYEILSSSQRRLPQLYLEHDPPRENPTDTRHPVDDANVLLVHVTAFNNLMWDAGHTPTCVIEHGIMVPESARYRGEREAGVVVVNNLAQRGRRLGLDVFERARAQVPLSLIGMGSEALGGEGELRGDRLWEFAASHRYFFNPIRYTSLGLAVCEAMMMGMPIVGLATTEMATVVENGVSGFVDTRTETLIERMQLLRQDAALARQLGDGARKRAQERFNIDRFKRDWDAVLRQVTGRHKDEARRAGGAA
jgi:glycosyltransferase involved in cell wall biosynthesis